MKILKAVLFSLWMTICLTLLLAGPVLAGDCSGPDDCGSIPDNASRAAGGGAAAAGAYFYVKSRKKPKESDSGEGEAADEDALFGG